MVESQFDIGLVSTKGMYIEEEGSSNIGLMNSS